MKIMSYNVQTGTPKPQRAADMLNNILDFDADIVGAQEVNTKWLYIFKGVDLFKKYGFIGLPRMSLDDLSNGNEYSPIIYKKDKFNVIYSGTLWLSETPKKISKIEGTAYTRIMTYALFERKDDKARFLHVNTHVDYNGAVNAAQVKILLDLTKNLEFDVPTFYTGDFNMFDDGEGYALMTAENDDARLIAGEKIESSKLSRYIDYVFTSKNDFTVERFEVTTRPGSDHDPLYVNLEINK